MRGFITLFSAVALLSACASQQPLSTREKGALTGAALGAGTGAIIGSATGKAGTGAAIGAGIGILTGAVIGGAIESQRGETAYPPPAPPAGPTQSRAPTQPAYPQADLPTPTSATVDPTAGQLVNATRWRLEVFVDVDPQTLQNAASIHLNPQESRQHNLDLGSHRVIAKAIADTQFGPRIVGRYDRSIQVDPRGSGWTLRFTETSFRD